jgi:hypothetical protein
MPGRLRVQALWRDVVAHIAPGADAVAEQVRLVIETAGILITMRALETHQQPPGFARARLKVAIAAVQ